MRTFVALNLAPHTRAALAASLEPLRERDLPVRWTREESLHVTLKFLGDIEGAEVPRLDSALRDVAARHNELALVIAGLGAFPSLRRANVVWLGVACEPLLALQRDLELALSRLGYVRDIKPFRPHMTVGRTQTGKRPPDVERLVPLYTHEEHTDVSTIDLMRSHSDPAGARYEPLLRVPLGAAPT